MPSRSVSIQHVTRLDRAIRRFATTQMPQFLQEDRSLQRQAIDIASRLNATVRRGRDVTITRTHDPDTDRAQLYAFINTLYTVAELHQRDRFRNKRITVSVKANGIASGAASPMESFMYINDNTIAMLSDLIQHVYFDEPLHEISDSSTAVLFSIVDWESMSILFFDAHSRVPNPLDGPRVAGEVGSEFMGDDDGDAVVADLPRRRRRTRNVGSLWRYLNKTDIDLSRYGIFTSFDVANYRYSCFIYALQQATPVSSTHSNSPVSSRRRRSISSTTPSTPEPSHATPSPRSVDCTTVTSSSRRSSTQSAPSQPTSRPLATVMHRRLVVSVSSFATPTT